MSALEHPSLLGEDRLILRVAETTPRDEIASRLLEGGARIVLLIGSDGSISGVRPRQEYGRGAMRGSWIA